MSLVQEKVGQAIEILRENEVDCWLTFVRESSAGGDPVLPLIYGHDLTWQSALILSRKGDRVAIVGHYEAAAAEATGAYHTVIGYHEAIRPDLLRVLERLDPQQIALNYSENDVMADGLSHGMYLLLRRYLEGTPFAGRFVSAEGIVGALRGRKTPGEIERIRTAIETTLGIYRRTFDWVQEGMTERQVSDFMHRELAERGLEAAWDYDGCPIVNTGPGSTVGHAAPGDLKIERGHILHLDFGVRQNGFCSDIQRVAYFLAPGESEPPEEVRRGFETVVRAIRAAVEAMKPGVLGKEVDAIARAVVTEAGYPEYKYA
ncbi:MAG: M24 family metallopeptidase, partial [Ardenticatenaceae bacterium]